MVILYKDGEASPPLYEVDARGWEKMGWTRATEGLPQEDVEPVPEPIVNEVIPVATHLKKLFETEGWLAIKDIASPLDIKKPDDGWGSAIPLIVAAGWTPED